MNYKRNIKFNFYQIKYAEIVKDEWTDLKVFNLVDWLLKIKRENKIQQSIVFGNTRARIETIKYDRANEVYGIRFMKLRDVNIPSKVKENQDAEVIQLADDEYIGEDLNVLYHKKTGILMIQSNRFALSVGKVEEFISYTWGNPNCRIYIEPIMYSNANEKIEAGEIKNIDISFANLTEWSDGKGKYKSLDSIIKMIKSYGGIVGHVAISLGHVKNESLNKNRSSQLAHEIRDSKKFINSAKMKVKEDDESETEIVDLFDCVYYDYIEFTLKSRETLSFEQAFRAQIASFARNKKKLFKLIAYNEG